MITDNWSKICQLRDQAQEMSDIEYESSDRPEVLGRGHRQTKARKRYVPFFLFFYID